MDFLLFLLLNAVLILRPAEIVPALLGLPLYNATILACLAVSAPSIVRQLTPRALAAQPVTACVLGVLAAVFLSLAANALFGLAVERGVEFTKTVLYYLLLVGVVNTPARLRRFMAALLCLVVAAAALALLQFHGVISVEALEALQQGEYDRDTGERFFYPRLVGTGIFNDPNDLSLILCAGIFICVCLAGCKRYGLRRFAWLAPLPVLTYALVLTRSRGGLLSLVGGLLAFLYARYGARKAVALAAVVLPAVALVFGGRQTDFSEAFEGGTGHTRVQIWADGWMSLKRSPVFGIGMGQFSDEIGIAAHNSFVHAFTELGVVGGTAFFGTFACAGWGMWRVVSARAIDPRDDMRRTAVYLLAVLVSYGVGLLALSRCYVASTYVALGLAAAHLNVAGGVRRPVLPTSPRLVLTVVAAGGAYMVAVYVFVFLIVGPG